jgi:hypothetical protein
LEDSKKRGKKLARYRKRKFEGRQKRLTGDIVYRFTETETIQEDEGKKEEDERRHDLKVQYTEHVDVVG